MSFFGGIALDGHGNVGLYSGGGVGLGAGAGAFGGVSAATSTGDTINDLGGPFLSVSGSAGAGPAETLDFFTGKGIQGQNVTGAGFTAGLGGGADASLQVTGTSVRPLFNIAPLFGRGGAPALLGATSPGGTGPGAQQLSGRK